MSLLCRIGLHRYGTWWPNVAPVSGGGPRFVEETCERCQRTKLTRKSPCLTADFVTPW